MSEFTLALSSPHPTLDMSWNCGVFRHSLSFPKPTTLVSDTDVRQHAR